MSVLPVLAYGFAATFRVRDLGRLFAGARLRLSKAQIVAEYADDRVAIGFDFGALVFVNVPAEERARVIGAVTAKIAVDEPHPPLEEDFLIEVDPAAPPEGVVRFDRVVVPSLSAPIAEIVTLLLAQSVSIDYYEEDLQEILGALERQIEPLARSGRPGGSTRALTRFVGSAIATKNQVIAALAVLDKPIATWESEALDRLYRELRTLLEIEERFRALTYKLRAIQESLEVLLDLSQTRRMLFLEATIVFLILVEIVMSLIDRL